MTVAGRHRPHPFLIVFQAVGWIVILSDIGVRLLWPDWVFHSSLVVLGPILEFLGLLSNDASFYQFLFVLLIYMSVFLVPQLAIALFGGWLNHRFEIRITTRQRRVAEQPTIRPMEAPEPIATPDDDLD